MSPKTGRPPKADASRTVKLNIRLTPKEADDIQRCADRLGTTRTDAIMLGIHKVLDENEK